MTWAGRQAVLAKKIAIFLFFHRSPSPPPAGGELVPHERAPAGALPRAAAHRAPGTPRLRGCRRPPPADGRTDRPVHRNGGLKKPAAARAATDSGNSSTAKWAG